MSKLIVFSHKPILQKGLISGPGIRVYNIAKALKKKGHDVSIAEKGRKITEEKEGVRFLAWEDTLLDNLEQFDAVFIQNWISDPSFLERISTLPVIVDVYAPYLIEHLYYHYEITENGFNDFSENVMIPFITPMLYGDFFICANKEQLNYYTGLLTYLGRLSPSVNGNKFIGIVPNGIKEIPVKNKKLISRKSKTKNIILWPGGFFPWMNPMMMVKAFEEVIKQSKDALLVFVGADNPNAPEALTKKYVKEVKNYIKSKKLQDKVIFLAWKKEKEYYNLYAEAMISVVTYKGDLEAMYSSRSRSLDAIQTKTPLITAKGDNLSELITKKKLGFVVDNNDHKELAKTILKLLKNKKGIKETKARIAKFLKKSFGWDEVVSELDEFCRNPTKIELKRKLNPYNLIAEKEKVNLIAKKEIREKNMLLREQTSQIKELFVIINKQKEIIKQQASQVGNFKASIVYPFYRITKRIGETKTGKKIERILK